MALDTCAIEFTKALEGTDADAEKLVLDIEREADFRADTNPSKSRAQHFDEIVDETIQRETVKAARNELALVKSIEAREASLRIARGFQTQNNDKPVTAFLKTINVLGDDVVGARHDGLGSFSLEIEEAGLDSFFHGLSRNDNDALDVLTEIGELAKGSSGKPGKTKSKEALQVAKIYQSTIDAYRARQKSLGIKVDNLNGRMLRQSWFPDSLRRFGTVNDFVDAMLPRINRARTFRRSGVTDQEAREFLQTFWQERVRGLEDEAPLTDKSIIRSRETFTGSQLNSREIFLNTPEDTLFVLKNFGDGDVVSATVTAVQQSAGKTRLTELFGANPRNTVLNLRNRLKQGAPDADAAELDNLPLSQTSRFGNPDAMMKIIDGSFEVESSSPNVRMVGHMIGNLARVRFLGGVVLSALPDVSTVNRASARIGAAGLENISNRFNLVMGRVDPKMKKMMARSIDTANAYNMGALAQRVAPNNVLAKGTNYSTYWSNWVMKWGGINKWTQHNKGVAYTLASSTISRLIGSKFESLDRGFQNMLLRGGVLKEDWDKLSAAKESARFKDKDGHEYLDLDALGEADADLARKFQNVLSQFANEAVPTPGVRERSLLTQGQDPGSIVGVMVRAITSLLGYPVTFMTRQMSAEMDLGGSATKSGMAKLAGTTLFAGYVTMLARDAAEGKTRDYLSDDLGDQAALMSEAMGRGGFGGFAASVILDSVRFGSPFSGLVGGAPLEALDQAFNGLKKSIELGAEGEVEEAASRFGQTVRPFIAPLNIPQTSIIFDTMVYQPFLEATNPAEMRRIEKAWERRTGGEFNVFRN